MDERRPEIHLELETPLKKGFRRLALSAVLFLALWTALLGFGHQTIIPLFFPLFGLWMLLAVLFGTLWFGTRSFCSLESGNKQITHQLGFFWYQTRSRIAGFDEVYAVCLQGNAVSWKYSEEIREFALFLILKNGKSRQISDFHFTSFDPKQKAGGMTSEPLHTQGTRLAQAIGCTFLEYDPVFSTDMTSGADLWKTCKEPAPRTGTQASQTAEGIWTWRLSHLGLKADGPGRVVFYPVSTTLLSGIFLGVVMIVILAGLFASGLPLPLLQIPGFLLLLILAALAFFLNERFGMSILPRSCCVDFEKGIVQEEGGFSPPFSAGMKSVKSLSLFFGPGSRANLVKSLLFVELPQGKFIKMVETVLRRDHVTAAPAQRLADFVGKPLVPNSPGLKEHLDRRFFQKTWHIVLVGVIYTLLLVVVVVMRYLKGIPMP